MAALVPIALCVLLAIHLACVETGRNPLGALTRPVEERLTRRVFSQRPAEGAAASPAASAAARRARRDRRRRSSTRPRRRRQWPRRRQGCRRADGDGATDGPSGPAHEKAIAPRGRVDCRCGCHSPPGAIRRHRRPIEPGARHGCSQIATSARRFGHTAIVEDVWQQSASSATNDGGSTIMRRWVGGASRGV